MCRTSRDAHSLNTRRRIHNGIQRRGEGGVQRETIGRVKIKKMGMGRKRENPETLLSVSGNGIQEISTVEDVRKDENQEEHVKERRRLARRGW